jgi:hypothetical protein
MADNYTTNPGTGGSTFAADDIGGVLTPRVKVQHGADGSAVDASSANPFPTADAAVAAAIATLITSTDGVEALLASLLAANGTQALTDAQLRAAAVVIKNQGGTLTDRSGAITTGGTAQQAMAANASRLGLSIQNLSTTADLWINSLGTASAAQPSIKLAPGAYFETPAGYGAVGALSVFSATSGVAFSAREW